MAKKTVLEYVQKCLDTMDSDIVDSISDTEEALQVASFLEEAYSELINRETWDFLSRPATLTSSSDPANPTHFLIAENIKEFEYISYVVDGQDNEDNELIYCEPVDFLKRFSRGGDNRQRVVIDNKVAFYVGTDRAPRYYTSFDEVSIVCDSFDSSLSSTLLADSLNMIAVIIPEFTVDNGFVPDLPTAMEPLLQSTLNAVSHLYLKQSVSAPDEKRSFRQLAQARRGDSKVKAKGGYYSRKYGRR